MDYENLTIADLEEIVGRKAINVKQEDRWIACTFDKSVMNQKPLKIAFDVDDTLLVPSVASGTGRDTPNYETIAIFRWFQAQGHYMVIWSGSGVDWAKTWAEKLGLMPDDTPMKGAYPVDIAFDDFDVTLGTVNVKVKRLNNGISRQEWNKTKQI